VLDRSLISDARDQALLADLLSGEFRIVSESSGIVVAERVRPPTLPLGENPPEGSCFARPSLNRFQPNLQASG
jgi:hypothetical protein